MKHACSLWTMCGWCGEMKCMQHKSDIFRPFHPPLSKLFSFILYVEFSFSFLFLLDFQFSSITFVIRIRISSPPLACSFDNEAFRIVWFQISICIHTSNNKLFVYSAAMITRRNLLSLMHSLLSIIFFIFSFIEFLYNCEMYIALMQNE